ncbi:SAM-dependent methyltransferase [Streptomyces sp. NRRL F-5126]|uniref:SAM-dependent methyltransferase n=1 Tax=Streptomyces sp. NRRL F-5126 TaxID=1463857 RepID=UPI0004CA2600|nr:SAM-dependent methyltransferase [Streptomyces sp. NRRL F-5126]
MTDTPDGRPKRQIDTSRASSARLYDLYVGGKDHYGVDKDAGTRLTEAFGKGSIQRIGTGARLFHDRAVRYAARELGMDQYLDVGVGVPKGPNTHEIAQAVHPASRVVYVDNDPIVLRHAEALLQSGPEGATDYAEADLREPDEVLAIARRTLDLDRPVALMLCSVLQFVPDDDEARAAVTAYLSALAPGSCLIFSHVTDDFAPEAWRETERVYAEQGIPANVRPRAAIESLVADLDLVPPGLVEVHTWHPDGTDTSSDHTHLYGAVGHKRA